MDYVCLSHTLGGFANINYAYRYIHSTFYIRTSEIYAEMFISLHQFVTKNQNPNAKFLFFVAIHKRTSCLQGFFNNNKNQNKKKLYFVLSFQSPEDATK